MPRALLLCEYPALNGGERSMLAVLPMLQQAGWEFDALAPVGSPIAKELANCAVENRANAEWQSPKVRRQDDRYRQLGDALRAGSYDLVHANSLATAVLSGMVAIDFCVPTIGYLRDIVGLSRTKISLLNSHTRLITVSEAVKRFHVGQGLDAAKTHVLYNGIDSDRFRSSDRLHRTENVDLRSELGIPVDSKIVGLIGQISLRKGFDVALDAAVPLLQRNRRLHVAIIGKRHSDKEETVRFEQDLHAIAANARIADRVQYLGTRDDVPTLLPQMSLLLHTARQEPLGRVLLEAAACGVPVVATDVGGTREIFPREDLDGALLVPVNDAAATQAAIERVLDDETLAMSMSIAGRARIVAAFSAERSAAGLLRHYAEVSGR